MSSNACVKTKKRQNSPTTIGLIRERIKLNLILVGGGGKTTPPTGKLEKTKNWSGPKARDDFFVSKI